jgi:hypothetical protein
MLSDCLTILGNLPPADSRERLSDVGRQSGPCSTISICVYAMRHNCRGSRHSNVRCAMLAHRPCSEVRIVSDSTTRSGIY